MCLYSKQILPRRATKDIIVYKEMVHIRHSDMYKTPFLDYVVTLKHFGDIKSAEGKKSIFRSNVSYINQVRTEITSGYFHCHRYLPFLKNGRHLGTYHICRTRDTKNMAVWVYNKVEYVTQWRVIECIIPKGSLYWIGIEDDICSDRLIFNKILSEEEINQILYNNEKALTNRMLISTK